MYLSNYTLNPYLLVYLIKRPGIIETAVPHLIHHPRRMHLILTARPVGHTQRRPPPHALLQLLGEVPLAPRKELPSPSTLPT